MLARSTRPDSMMIKTISAFAAIYVIWGTTYLAIRIAVETIPPFLMAGTRFLIAGALSFALLRARNVPAPSLSEWRSAAIIGGFLLVGGNGLVTWSEQHVPSSIAALVVATVPLWIVLFDWLFYKGPRPTKLISAGLAVGFVGVAILIGPGHILGTSAFGLTGLLILLLAPVLWSLGSLQSRRAALPSNVFMSAAAEMLAGGVLLSLAGFATGEAALIDFHAVSFRSLAAVLYLTLFGSVIALTAYTWLMKTAQPARVATYTFVNPIIAVGLGWLILSEPITTQTLAAVAIITAAVVLITVHRTGSHRVAPVIPEVDAPRTSSCAAD